MERDEHGRGDGDAARERYIPSSLTGSTSERKCERDDRRLLNARDPPLRRAQLREQAERKDQAEHSAPAHVEDLVARLIDVAGEAVDQIDQPEVDRQRSEGG